MPDPLLNYLFAGIDWLSVLTIFAIALFYFLAPVFHYSAWNRFWIKASLWTLIVKMGLPVFKIAWIHLTIFSEFTSGNQKSAFGGTAGLEKFVTFRVLEIGFPPLEAGLFVLALVFFVFWLTGLRRREMPPPE
jgi:hypothetical protein